MSDNLLTALAFLTAHDASFTEPTVTHTVVAKTTTVSRKARAKSTGEVAAPSTDKVEPLSMPLPAAGTLDAKSFIIACRKAQSRDEVICAIAGYVGYDRRADFGSQEMLAKLQANREMRPGSVVAAPYRRSTVPSIAGYVAGVPDHNAKTINDLRTRRLRAAKFALSWSLVDSLSAFEQVAREYFAETPEAQAVAGQLISHVRTTGTFLAIAKEYHLIEAGRVEHLEQDLARF